MVMLEEIKDYKDANNLLEDCKYQQSVDAQFIRALAKGLMERWDLNVDNSSMSATEIKENYKKCVNAELNSIGEFADKKFENQGLKKNMDRYIEALNIQLNAIDHYELDYTRFNNEWSDGYNKRAVLIKKFVRNYDLKVESEYESDIDSFINDADLITEQENIKEKVEKMISVEFDIVENNYGWKTYEATIENITDVTFLYFAVIANLYDENDIIVESPYTNQINNFEPGQKVKVSFTTDKSFVRMDTEVNYSVK